MKTKAKKSANKNPKVAKSKGRKVQTVKNKLFPIVAIGASAGGLEAYSELLRNVSPDTGMAFVIIQHLDPVHKSFLNEILSRETDMKVNVASEGMKPEPNNVYVIPPNAELEIINGTFRISPRQKSLKLRMPIDTFMRTLAEDNIHYAIGVILSGTDADGAIGLETIKSEGGITYAQDKKTAKFYEMPRNAVNAGVVDFILSPTAIARELGRISRNPYLRISRPNTPEELIPDGSIEIDVIYTLLNANNGVDFRDYKPTTVKRRILRRMVVQKIDHIKDYVRYLKSHPVELDALCEDILINVTSFFRDPEMYESLKEKVFPEIFKTKDRSTPIRVWVSACSTGEEAYSMAIAMLEFLESKNSQVPVQIFSTDLSDLGIEKARSGIYTEDIKNDVSPDRLRKYFMKVDSRYQINKTIRDMCVFAKQNLIQDPPFSKIDLISCRNVLIYLGQVLQNRILPVFHYALNANGYLVLGSSETVGGFISHFDIIDKKNKIYRKRAVPTKTTFDFTRVNIRPHAAAGHKMGTQKPEVNIQTEPDFQKQADSMILNRYAPASVVVNSNMEIIQFRGRTNRYLDFPRGEPTYNLLRIAREGLSIELRHMLRKAIRENIPVKSTNVKFNHNANTKQLNLMVIPLGSGTKADKAYLVVFEEKHTQIEDNQFAESDRFITRAERKRPRAEKIIQLRKELFASKENMQHIIEQLEATNEELRSANEEIQSSNEELQSTNEELETAKEELQSTNEELTTVNEELQNRNTELGVVNNDLNNLLSSVNIPIVMLDNNLHIRRFTNVAGRILNLIPTDVGRKITDLKINVNVPAIEKLIAEVIEIPTTKELTVEDNDGSWYSMRIRPYKTLENKIDGVIIAFVDITELRRLLSKEEESKKEIAELNIGLEKRVGQRTAELESLNKKLEGEISERLHAEESLRVLSRHLVKAQEAERLRISRELHDSINQILSMTKMKIHSIQNTLRKDNDYRVAAKDISEARQLLEKAIGEVRQISMNLRPLSLDELGLKDAIHSMIEEFKDRTKIKADFKIKNLKQRLPSELELIIYRMIQESLNNVEKHSEANLVNIEIEMRNSQLYLNIRDNGKGFKTDGKAKRIDLKKYGILGMRERAEAIGGDFTVTSVQGNGTEINVTLPVTANK